MMAAAGFFRAYAASLPISLDYQDFDSELAALPGKYAPPAGGLLLAWDHSGQAIGCAALRPLEKGSICEMKRLYVAPQGRGRGLGRALAAAIIDLGRTLGYAVIRLDTLPSMTGAQGLYRDLGFIETAPYYAGAAPGTLFMEKRL